jgi:hypothetical protein
MIIQWPKIDANKLNNEILLCLTETNKFIIVFQLKKQGMVEEHTI